MPAPNNPPDVFDYITPEGIWAFLQQNADVRTSDRGLRDRIETSISSLKVGWAVQFSEAEIRIAYPPIGRYEIMHRIPIPYMTTEDQIGMFCDRHGVSFYQRLEDLRFVFHARAVECSTCKGRGMVYRQEALDLTPARILSTEATVTLEKCPDCANTCMMKDPGNPKARRGEGWYAFDCWLIASAYAVPQKYRPEKTT